MSAAPTPWAAEPEHSDTKVREATGAGWDEWVQRIDAGPGREASHTQIAAWLHETTDMGGWWAQGVTLGYERITGRRLPGQMPDGTFSVSRSRTLPVPPAQLRERLDDEQALAALLPGLAVTRASRAGVKAPRFTLSGHDSLQTADARAGGEVTLATGATTGAGGEIQLRFDATATGTRLTVTHSRLGSAQDAELWRERWARWLADRAEDTD